MSGKLWFSRNRGTKMTENGRLYWENSGLSEISTQTLGNVNIHGFGGGV